MRLNLREIIEVPGGSVPFEAELDTERLDFPSVVRYVSAPEAEGLVQNTAGVLGLTGTLRADMICINDNEEQDFDTSRRLLHEAFRQILPEKSAFEL